LRVNLETGKTLKVSVEGHKEFVLKGLDSQVFYFAENENQKEDNSLEIGKLDTVTLARMPLFELKRQKDQEFNPCFSVTRDGKRLALTEQQHEASHIYIYRKNALEKTIPVAERGIALGNAEWSSDEKTIYAAFSRKSDSGDKTEFGILGVPVDGGTIHKTILFAVEKSDAGDISTFQIALSPDGRRIAVTSALHNPKDQALYLIDVGSAKWEATKIPVPFTSNMESATEKN
jgi:Tol biopolymer transport system component